MARFLSLLLFVCSSAFAQFTVTPGTTPTHIDPNRLMPAGKIYVDEATVPAARTASSTYDVTVFCTGTFASCYPTYTPDTTTPGDPTGGNGGGALRLNCGVSHYSNDDPIVWPGLPNRTHKHQFFGNDKTSSGFDVANQATQGNSTCDSGIANRTGYWVPVLLYHCPNAALSGCTASRNGEVQPAKNSVPGNAANLVYYKSGESNFFPDESGMEWPVAKLVMIAGNSTATALQGFGARFGFACTNATGSSGDDGGAGFYGRIPTTSEVNALSDCNDFQNNVVFPSCVNDAQATDSPDHKSHVQYRIPDGSHAGYLACPTGFSHHIPTISVNIHYSIPSRADFDYLRLSSDPPEQYGNTQTSADASHIKLAAGEPSTTDWYLHGVLCIGGVCRHITGYDGTTKIATVSAAFSGTPANATPYAVRQPAGMTTHADWANGWDQTTLIPGGTMTITNAILNKCLRVLINCGTDALSDANSAHDNVSDPSNAQWFMMFGRR